MLSRSPTLEGFRTILRRPSFGFAEIAWRWSFGAAALTLIAFSLREYLATLPVSREDLVLLNTHQPTLIGRAMADIFHGSGFRLVRSSIVLALALSLGWIVIATLSRGGTVKALVEYYAENFETSLERATGSLSSLFGLHFLRLAATLAATIGIVAAFVLSARAGQSTPEVTAFVFMAILSCVCMAWSVLNWFLSLASVFAVVAAEGTFDSVASAIDLCRNQTGRVLAAGTWFGFGHVVAFFVASSIAAFPLAFARLLPPAVVLGGVLMTALLYFAIVDFLYAGRLAAYVAMIKLPPEPVVAESKSIPTIPNNSVVLEERKIDQAELILSDIPLPG